MKNTQPSAEVLDGLRKIDSATVSNSIEAFRVRGRTEGYTSMELRCLLPELNPMVGYAVTCKADSTSPGPRKTDRLHDLLDAVAAAPKPAVVVVQSTGSDRMRSCFIGDMISTAYQKLGVVGAVTDGGIRDLAGIRLRAPGFQVFAPGKVVSHGNCAILEVGVSVSVCGLSIDPGDLLHGDENGLLTVPLDIAGSVLEQAKRVLESEKEYFDFLQSSDYSFEGLKRLIAFPEPEKEGQDE